MSHLTNFCFAVEVQIEFEHFFFISIMCVTAKISIMISKIKVQNKLVIFLTDFKETRSKVKLKNILTTRFKNYGALVYVRSSF